VDEVAGAADDGLAHGTGEDAAVAVAGVAVGTDGEGVVADG